MKRIISLIAVGIAYVIFVAVISFFNNKGTSLQTDGKIQNKDREIAISYIPPIPPPPPKGGN